MWTSLLAERYWPVAATLGTATARDEPLALLAMAHDLANALAAEMGRMQSDRDARVVAIERRVSSLAALRASADSVSRKQLRGLEQRVVIALRAIDAMLDDMDSRITCIEVLGRHRTFAAVTEGKPSPPVRENVHPGATRHHRPPGGTPALSRTRLPSAASQLRRMASPLRARATPSAATTPPEPPSSGKRYLQESQNTELATLWEAVGSIAASMKAIADTVEDLKARLDRQN